MKYNKFQLFVTLFYAITMCGCSSDDGRGTDPRSDGRVILVYIGGDNNLSGEAWFKAEGMADAMAACEKGTMLIYLDPGDMAPRMIEVNHSGNGNGRSETVMVFDESDSSDPEVFQKVIHKMLSEYPATSYGLYVFSHGSGWLPPGALAYPTKDPSSVRSIIMDKKNEMELADFARVIPEGVFDFIVFEACHMAGIEVAYELRHKTPQILASSAEIVSPGFSLIYGRLMPMLFKANPDLAGFARIVSEYIENDAFYKASTISVISTDALEKLAAWIKDNIDFELETDIYSIQKFDTNSHRLFFDLEHYYCGLLGDTVKESLLKELISNCVIYKNATDDFLLNVSGIRGFEIIHHSGLTTYIEQERFEYLNRKYTETAWYQATR